MPPRAGCRCLCFWEGPPDAWDAVSESEASEANTLEVDMGQDAGQRLFENMVALRRDGHASSRAVYTIAYWADRAGAVGVANLAQAPGSSSDDFQRMLDRATVFNPTSSRFFDVSYPDMGRICPELAIACWFSRPTRPW